MTLRFERVHVRTVLIRHDDSLLDRDVVAPWLGSFSELAGVVVVREPRSNRLARIRREELAPAETALEAARRALAICRGREVLAVLPSDAVAVARAV